MSIKHNDTRKILGLIQDWNAMVENKGKTHQKLPSSGNRTAEFDRASASKGGQDRHLYGTILSSKIIHVFRVASGVVILKTQKEKQTVSETFKSIKENNPDLAKEMLAIVRLLKLLRTEYPNLATEFCVEMDQLATPVTHKHIAVSCSQIHD